MGSLSKICATCRKCRFVDTCQNKQMEAYAYIDAPVKVCAESVNATNPLLQSAAKKLDLSETLKCIDPSEMYKGTEMEGLDALARQLRRISVDVKRLSK